MLYSYSNHENADLVFIYPFSKGSTNAAVLKYRMRHSKKKCSGAITSYRAFQHFHGNMSFPGIGATAERTGKHGKRSQVLHTGQHCPGHSTKRFFSDSLTVNYMSISTICLSMRLHHVPQIAEITNE